MHSIWHHLKLVRKWQFIWKHWTNDTGLFCHSACCDSTPSLWYHSNLYQSLTGHERPIPSISGNSLVQFAERWRKKRERKGDKVGSLLVSCIPLLQFRGWLSHWAKPRTASAIVWWSLQKEVPDSHCLYSGQEWEVGASLKLPVLLTCPQIMRDCVYI